MRRRRIDSLYAAAFAAALLVCSCSTTRFLGENEYRLSSNSVIVNGKADFKTSELIPYIKQQPNSYFLFGWNPFLNVWNWGDNSGKGFDRIFRKVGVAPVVFNPSLLESSCENISAHLGYLGYYNSSVRSEVLIHDKLASVNYIVDLGRRYVVDEINFELPEDNAEFASIFRADENNILIKEGGYLSESVLEQESIRSSSYFRNRGYYDFNKGNYFFTADTLSSPGRATLTYAIKPYTRNEVPDSSLSLVRSRIGNVTISHSSDIRFREEPLKKLCLVHPGDLYSESDINKTYSRYSSLKLFSSVLMQLQPRDSAIVDCDITLSESKRQGFKTDLELSTNSSGLIGVSPQLNWFHKNVFHGGEWLSVGFTGDFQFKPGTDVKSNVLGISTSLSFPSFLGLPYTAFKGSSIPRTDIKFSYNYQDRPEYLRHVLSSTFGYNWHTDGNTYFVINPLQLNYVNLSSMTEEFTEFLSRHPYMQDTYIDHINVGVGGTIYHTSNSDIVPKTSYRFLMLNLDSSGNLISLFNSHLKGDDEGRLKLFGVPYMQFVRAELQLANVVRFGSDNGHALAMRFWTGYGHAYGNSAAMPYEKQFYCGGANSMRAWQTHSLGPGCSEMDPEFSIPSQTGDFKLEADLEWRFKMIWKLEGALFGEVGNVWEMSYEKPSFASLAADWGLGLRLNLDFILVRLDAGFKVREPSRQAGSRWIGPGGWFAGDGYAIHFGVGYPF